MTIEQMKEIGTRAAAICGAKLSGEPTLKNGVWTVGFRQYKEVTALEVGFSDREVANDSELLKAEIDLERTMRGGILMST